MPSENNSSSLKVLKAESIGDGVSQTSNPERSVNHTYSFVFLLSAPPALADAVKNLVHTLDGLLVDGRHASALVQDDNVVDVHGAVCFGLLMQIYIVFSRSLQRLQGLQNSYLTIPGIIRIFATL